MPVIKKLSYSFLTFAILASTGFAYAAYPTEISYNIVNNSKLNLTGIPAHTSLPPSTLHFPSDRPYAYSFDFGVQNTPVRLCVGVGVNNFSVPYVGAYAATNADCPVLVNVHKNVGTNYYTVIVSDNK